MNLFVLAQILTVLLLVIGLLDQFALLPTFGKPKWKAYLVASLVLLGLQFYFNIAAKLEDDKEKKVYLAKIDSLNLQISMGFKTVDTIAIRTLAIDNFLKNLNPALQINIGYKVAVNNGVISIINLNQNQVYGYTPPDPSLRNLKTEPEIPTTVTAEHSEPQTPVAVQAKKFEPVISPIPERRCKKSLMGGYVYSSSITLKNSSGEDLILYAIRNPATFDMKNYSIGDSRSQYITGLDIVKTNSEDEAPGSVGVTTFYFTTMEEPRKFGALSVAVPQCTDYKLEFDKKSIFLSEKGTRDYTGLRFLGRQ